MTLTLLEELNGIDLANQAPTTEKLSELSGPEPAPSFTQILDAGMLRGWAIRWNL